MPISTGNAEEDARIQAMFAQSADQWEQTQEDMSLYAAPNRTCGKPDSAGSLVEGTTGQSRFAPHNTPPQMRQESSTIACRQTKNRRLGTSAIDAVRKVIHTVGGKCSKAKEIRPLDPELPHK